MTAIADLSATALAAAIRERAISPVEAVETALKRIEAGHRTVVLPSEAILP